MEKNNKNDYILTPYTDKTCSDTMSINEKKIEITIANNELKFPVKDNGLFLHSR